MYVLKAQIVWGPVTSVAYSNKQNQAVLKELIDLSGIHQRQKAERYLWYEWSGVVMEVISDWLWKSQRMFSKIQT